MHRHQWRDVVYAGAFTLATVTSCGGPRGPTADTAELYAGPLRSRDIERGGHIFRTFCSPCHAGRVSPEGYRWSPAQMRRQIREGTRAMPAIRPEYLSAEDMEAVLAFLTVIGAVDAPLPPLPATTESAPPPPPEPTDDEADPTDDDEETVTRPEEAPTAADGLGDPRELGDERP